MLVRYKGPKAGGIHIHIPVGFKDQGSMKKFCTNVHFNPTAELSEEHAIGLIAVHPEMFEAIDAEGKAIALDLPPDLEIPFDPSEEDTHPKKGGKKRGHR